VGTAPAGKVLMASRTKVTPPAARKETPEKPPESPDELLPLFDLSDAAVREIVKAAKTRGYVTHEQTNSALPPEEVTSEQIEDLLAALNEVGINIVESEEAEFEEGAEARDEPGEEENEGGQVRRPSPAKVAKAHPSERIDDPVRMYLRAISSVELLTREGEIAIAKRIEAGREAMIAGLCESALTFRAISIWRDELNDGKVFLRDIVTSTRLMPGRARDIEFSRSSSSMSLSPRASSSGGSSPSTICGSGLNGVAEGRSCAEESSPLCSLS
jgi:RNA polymerase primary sigma factor